MFPVKEGPFTKCLLYYEALKIEGGCKSLTWTACLSWRKVACDCWYFAMPPPPEVSCPPQQPISGETNDDFRDVKLDESSSPLDRAELPFPLVGAVPVAVAPKVMVWPFRQEGLEKSGVLLTLRCVWLMTSSKRAPNFAKLGSWLDIRWQGE